MHLREFFLKNKLALKLTAVYTGMTILILTIVSFTILFILGFRIDIDNGQIEQYSLLQFNSNPTGATVLVDGEKINSQTPNKISVHAGKHDITITREGYEVWRKTINSQPGSLVSLIYPMLIPKKLLVEPVYNYDSIFKVVSSTNGQSIAIQKLQTIPNFLVANLGSDNVRQTEVILPMSLYSDAEVIGVSHIFSVERWDNGGRYLLIKHTYNNKIEWLTVDTQNTNLAKNITKIFNLPLSSLIFSGDSGNILFALNSGDLRKIDLAAGTISKALVQNVSKFDLYSDDIITYIGKDTSSKNVAGIYRDGDSKPYVLKVLPDSALPFFIKTSRYFNDDYAVIIEGNKIDIMTGNYQASALDDSANLKIMTSFETTKNVENVSFSPDGKYIMMQSGADFTSYDLEYGTLTNSTVDNSGTTNPLQWLNASYLWSDGSDMLTIREFDGANTYPINSVFAGQDVVMTKNSRWLYSIGKTESGYQLQRVRIAP